MLRQTSHPEYPRFSQTGRVSGTPFSATKDRHSPSVGSSVAKPCPNAGAATTAKTIAVFAATAAPEIPVLPDFLDFLAIAASLSFVSSSLHMKKY